MEIFLLLIIVIILIVILNNLNSKFENLRNSISELQKKINVLGKQLESEKSVLQDVKEKKQEVFIEVVKEDSKELVFEKINVDKVVHPIQEKGEAKLEKTQIEEVKQSVPVFTTPNPVKRPKYVIPEKSWFEKFRENNPDLEKFVGENLINKIGILILVLGISFFVKYAIDKNWINETARVAIGILAGSLVMGIAHKLKKNYKAFSSVIVAGAISIFYFTIAIAFHEYHLFSQTVAFAIMVIITAFSTFVSLAYDRQELAVLSLIGGFAVPFMLSTGQGNYVALFIYITILNSGILAIAYHKKWNLVAVLSFVFTTLLYFSWYVKELDASTLPHRGAFIFASIFYFLFSVIAVLNNIRNKGLFSTIDYFIVIVNTFVYFGLGLGIIHNWGIDAKGLFTLSLAIYNLVYAGLLYKRFELDKNAAFLLIGFVFTFITITIPVQFEGNQITLFWACETVLLLWLSQKSRIGLFKITAVLVQILTVISLMMDWSNSYNNYENKLTVIFNPVFLTGIVVLGSFAATYFLLKKEDEKTKVFSFVLDPEFYIKIIQLAMLSIGYFVGIFEVAYQADQFLANESSSLALPTTYHYVFSAVLVFLGLKLSVEKFLKPITIVIIINTFLYIVRFCRIPSEEVANNIVNKFDSSTAFYCHYIILACMIYFVSILLQQILNKTAFDFLKLKSVLWILVFSGVYILSNELIVHSLFFTDTTSILANAKKLAGSDVYLQEQFVYDDLDIIKTQVSKIGYPILWGILSFILLIFGIKKQWKELRIIALSLLGLTIVKLFVYDINNVSETGKIVAFILLGVLILIISFVYQKIKKLVVDENITSNTNEKNN